MGATLAKGVLNDPARLVPLERCVFRQAVLRGMTRRRIYCGEGVPSEASDLGKKRRKKKSGENLRPNPVGTNVNLVTVIRVADPCVAKRHVHTEQVSGVLGLASSKQDHINYSLRPVLI